MPKYRTQIITDAESIATAGTWTRNIDMREKISRISIEAKATNNGSTPTAHPAAILSKIELVDGRDVLYSLSGYEAEAANILDYGFKPYQEVNFIDNNSCVFAVNLDFGRYLWDEKLALDPARDEFKNLQLRITHNKASGGSAPDAGTLSVFAHLFDQKTISPVGFRQTKEYKSEALAASTHFYTNLPVDMTMRRLIIMARYTGLNPFSLTNKVKLTEDGGASVVLDDIRVSDHLKVGDSNPYFDELIRESASTSARTNYCTPTYDTKITWAPILGTDSGWLGLASYGGTYTSDVSAATEGDEFVRGKAPHGAINFAFGKQDDLNDWYDLQAVKQLRLDITSGGSASSSHSYQLVCDQLRRY